MFHYFHGHLKLFAQMTLNCCVLSLKRSILTLWWCRSKQVFLACYLILTISRHTDAICSGHEEEIVILWKSYTHLFRPCLPCQIFSIQGLKCKDPLRGILVNCLLAPTLTSFFSEVFASLCPHSRLREDFALLRLIIDASHFKLTLIKCHSMLMTFPYCV